MGGKRQDRGATRIDVPDRVAAARGRKGTVVWAEDARGRMPGKDYFDSLPPKERNKMKELFQLLADDWWIASKEKFNREEGEFWAFKDFQNRLIGAYRPGFRFVVVHGLQKQTPKMPREAIERAARVLAEWDTLQDARRRN